MRRLRYSQLEETLDTYANSLVHHFRMSASGKYHILIGSRDLGKAKKAIEAFTDDKTVDAKPENVEAIEIEMSSDESIQAAAKTVEQKYGRLG